MVVLYGCWPRVVQRHLLRCQPTWNSGRIVPSSCNRLKEEWTRRLSFWLVDPQRSAICIQGMFDARLAIDARTHTTHLLCVGKTTRKFDPLPRDQREDDLNYIRPASIIFHEEIIDDEDVKTASDQRNFSLVSFKELYLHSQSHLNSRAGCFWFREESRQRLTLLHGNMQTKLG